MIMHQEFINMAEKINGYRNQMQEIIDFGQK